MAKKKQEAKNFATMSEHLSELRKRMFYSILALFISFAFCYYNAEYIFAFLTKPLAAAYQDSTGRRLIYTGMTEAFFTYMRVSFYASIFLAFPFVASQLYIFLAPGLYKNEKRVLIPFLVATPILFALGAALLYYFILPLAWQFFIGFESFGASGGMPIELEARVSEYLDLVIQLILGFGIAFQLPVLLVLLAKIGIVTPEFLAKQRKYAIVIAFIVGAILTPPDVISQIALASALLILYELSIAVCRYINRKNNNA